MNKLLPVFEIERFAIHDGNGIRTAIFLQGCPLHCKWCANPESQSIGRHIMHSDKLCSGCGKCAKACEKGAVSISGGKAVIDREICSSCGKCAEACPTGARKILGKMMSCEEIFRIVMRDKAYYEESCGGITLSGGEALLHIYELVPLLEMCREQNINIAVETCGCVNLEYMKTAEKYIDTFLFDIKALDEKKLVENTGGKLETVKKAFEYICKSKKVIARVPVIPDFNYDEKDIREIMRYVGANGVREIHLLPYHVLGMEKYAQLGVKYPYHITKGLDGRLLEVYTDIGGEYDLKVKIGG